MSYAASHRYPLIDQSYLYNKLIQHTILLSHSSTILEYHVPMTRRTMKLSSGQSSPSRSLPHPSNLSPLEVSLILISHTVRTPPPIGVSVLLVPVQYSQRDWTHILLSSTLKGGLTSELRPSSRGKEALMLWPPFF